MKTLIKQIGLVSVLLLAQQLPAAEKPQQPAGDVDEVKAYVEALRSDVNSAKIQTINSVMKLTEKEAEVFWPIYRKYEQELAGVGDRKLAMIREFAGFHLSNTLDDKSAKNLAERWLKNVQERLDLWKKYHKQISKALSPMRAAQFLQVEHQMALFIDLSIASEMPAVGSKPGERK